MRANRFLPALAFLLFLPARADEGATKAPPRTDSKMVEEKTGCCAGEDGADKALCPKKTTQSKKAGKKTTARAGTAASSKSAPVKEAAAKASPASGAANMIVTRDPVTGEIRNATAAEREQLVGRRPLTAPEHRVVNLPDGSVMVELNEADMSYAVATRNPDGTVSQSCVHGDANAAKAASSPAPAPAPAKPEVR